ncbi:MAG: hypothetical protein II588_05220 [Paludibacteraceae bacterium]|nr:hypothetical protein [Paludibacteraceae bacterium]
MILTLALLSSCCMLLADNNTTELTDDSIIALVAGQEFDQDAYMAQLESMAGDDYKKYQAMQERFGIDEQQRAEAEMAKKQRLWLIGILSLIIALVPAFTILKQVITGEIKPAGTAAVLKTVGVLFGWGIVLFAFNFGWLWVLLIGGTKFMGAILGLALLAFVVYAAVSVNKYYKKLNDKSSK